MKIVFSFLLNRTPNHYLMQLQCQIDVLVPVAGSSSFCVILIMYCTDIVDYADIDDSLSKLSLVSEVINREHLDL